MPLCDTWVVDALSKQRILVVGDVMLDEYHRGVVSRMSPEAPVAILNPSHEEKLLGGAANVAQNVATLGCQVQLCGVVGDDPAGNALVDLLCQAGIANQGMLVCQKRRTTHKLRLVAQVQHLLRIDRETKTPISATVENAAWQFISAQLPNCQAVVLSDYKKGFLTPSLIQAIIQAAHAKHIKVVVDPKGFDYQIYQYADVLTPNLTELEQATGFALSFPTDLTTLSESPLVAAAAKLLAHTQAQAVLITCGKHGMVLYESTGVTTYIPACVREVYDVTGAGDTVVAALAAAYSSGADLPTAARLANVAAGIAVSKLGTSTVTAHELYTALERAEGDWPSKLLPVSLAQDLCARAQYLGQSVVFTNGCFDLLHAGHAQYLQKARQMGHLLVVGLNSDASVRALKGAPRPLMHQIARAQVLSALSCVDAVIIFDEPTPAALVAALKPNILVKGADYTDREVVGREVVEALGGRVELVPLHAGFSTTQLIRNLSADKNSNA